MKTFTAGQTLQTRSACDYDCIFRATVISRTAKRITIKMHGKEKVCGVHADSEGEYIFPMGRHSMAAVFHA